MDIFDQFSNDNSPSGNNISQGAHTSFLDSGDTIGIQKTAKDKAYSSFTSGFSTQHAREHDFPAKPEKTTGFLNNSITFFAVLSLWVFALIAAFIGIGKFPEPVSRILILAASGWVALFFTYVCKHQRRDFFRDLGLSSVLGALIGAVLVAMSSYNMPLDFFALSGGFAFITTLLAVILKERYFLTISNLATLSWTAYSLQFMQIPSYYWVFPALLVVQIALAIEIKAKIPLVLASISGIFWLITNLVILALAAKISVLMAITTVFIAGITYSRFGKSMQDNQILSGLFQTNIGWGIAVSSALVLQDYWLMDAPRMPWSNLSSLSVFEYPMTAQWCAFIVLCILLIGLSGLLRLRAQKQTFLGGIGVIGFATLLPASIVFKSQLITFAEQFGISATPSFGLCIGGAITGLALGMLANGLRRNKPLMILLALLTLSAEAIIVMDSVYNEPDNLMLFGFSILVMALTAGLYAHNGQKREVQKPSIEGAHA